MTVPGLIGFTSAKLAAVFRVARGATDARSGRLGGRARRKADALVLWGNRTIHLLSTASLTLRARPNMLIGLVSWEPHSSGDTPPFSAEEVR